MQRRSDKRDAIYAALCASRLHPTAQELWEALRDELPGLSLSTVYRNLSEFVAEGRAIRVPSGNGHERFDARTAPHAHFVCTCCGQVRDVPFAADPAALLEGEAARALEGFQVQGHELSFSGLCYSCAAGGT